jgi:hypothetical protein
VSRGRAARVEKLVIVPGTGADLGIPARAVARFAMPDEVDGEVLDVQPYITPPERPITHEVVLRSGKRVPTRGVPAVRLVDGWASWTPASWCASRAPWLLAVRRDAATARWVFVIDPIFLEGDL